MSHSVDLPEITITLVDYDRLSNLAESSIRDAPDVAAFLMEELARATIAHRPSDAPVVRMGSCVYFQDENETVQRIHLVYPDQSNPGIGHISILTPVGAALIGLSPGQSIKWRDRRGELKTLTVLAVHNSSATPN